MEKDSKYIKNIVTQGIEFIQKIPVIYLDKLEEKDRKMKSWADKQNRDL